MGREEGKSHDLHSGGVWPIYLIKGESEGRLRYRGKYPDLKKNGCRLKIGGTKVNTHWITNKSTS